MQHPPPVAIPTCVPIYWPLRTEVAFIIIFTNNRIFAKTRNLTTQMRHHHLDPKLLVVDCQTLSYFLPAYRNPIPRSPASLQAHP
jgi:hypothetical protein